MTATTFSRIRTVAIAVTDQDRALRFYLETLRFEKRMDQPIGDGIRWIEVAPPGARVSLALTPESDDLRAGSNTGIRFASADVNAEHRTLTHLGVDTDALLDWPDVPAMFTFRDVDGNTLYVVESD